MRRIILACLTSAFALAACVRVEEYEAHDGIQMEIKATSCAETKTAIQDGSQSVYWEPGEKVAILYENSVSMFTSQNTEPVACATFSGTLNTVDTFNEGFTFASPLWGLYPYQEDASLGDNGVTATLRQNQEAKAGTFSKDTYITMAMSRNNTMGFYAVCGGIRFSLTTEGVKQVEFESLGSEALAGTFTADFEDGRPVISDVSNEKTKIILRPSDGGTFKTGTWYYIVALPTTLSEGYSVHLQ